MIKLAVRLAVLMTLLVGTAVFLLAYQVIQTDSGFHIVQKDDWGFDKTWVDTRDWNAVDYLKNTDISKKLAKIEWEKFGDRAQAQWQKLQKTMDEAFEGQDMDDLSAKAKEKLADLRHAAQKKYDKLEKQFQNGDFSWESFQKKVAELEAWLDKQIEKLRANF
ncbi:hypothetical protein [Acanthopleuribacter pedis]|uniref:Uncharacterized protein n=1 Tax=Acanthopleuribacter pedis TaxID=442870 RepID=A0A8J7U2W6_9BACT|nr:hypothetical protein [Acanthopleuribacter pedis]MBO1319007.1 hypothetical protein [Acanthopleuribacter pedis]